MTERYQNTSLKYICFIYILILLTIVISVASINKSKRHFYAFKTYLPLLPHADRPLSIKMQRFTHLQEELCFCKWLHISLVNRKLWNLCFFLNLFANKRSIAEKGPQKRFFSIFFYLNQPAVLFQINHFLFIGESNKNALRIQILVLNYIQVMSSECHTWIKQWSKIAFAGGRMLFIELHRSKVFWTFRVPLLHALILYHQTMLCDHRSTTNNHPLAVRFPIWKRYI